MDTIHGPIAPEFKEGDKVYYAHSNAADGGKVTKVSQVIVYRYEVEWDDGDPTDIYTANQLSLEPISDNANDA